jgi:hypothetical protein
VWVEKNKNSLNLKFKTYNISWTVKLARISFKLLNYIVSYYPGTVVATVTLGVSHPQHVLDATIKVILKRTLPQVLSSV